MKSYLTEKRKEIFLIYKEFRSDRVQSPIWLTASSYTRLNNKYLHISLYIRKPFLKYVLAPDHFWIPLHMRKMFYAFLNSELELWKGLISQCNQIHVSFVISFLKLATHR
jgi:hypothetical protein